MGKVAKQSIQTTIFSYIGVVIGYFNVLWLYPYAMDASELGTFRTIQDLGLLLSFCTIRSRTWNYTLFPKVGAQ